MADCWSRPQLSRRDRSMIVVTFLSCLSATEELILHAQIALRNGCTRTEIEEVVLQVAGYAGFPRAMHAARHVETAWKSLDGVDRLAPRPAATPRSDAERRAAGAEVLSAITGGRTSSDPEQALAAITGDIGGVGQLAFEWGFGELWSRPELSRRDRSLVVIAILGILGREAELRIHIPAGIRNGLSRTEIEEIFVQLAVYGGFPLAVEATRLARSIWKKADGAA
jgi:4-carboxymuconolactone decarboxylase